MPATKAPKLPDKPSALIRLALRDLAKVERSKNYRVHMSTWHDGTGGVCAVCLAGAVMAKSLNCNRAEYLLPSNLPYPLNSKLGALNFFRIGQIEEGLAVMQVFRKVFFPNRYIVRYQDDSLKFKSDMQQLARDLAAANL